jgi:hypothetical protein
MMSEELTALLKCNFYRQAAGCEAGASWIFSAVFTDVAPHDSAQSFSFLLKFLHFAAKSIKV